MRALEQQPVVLVVDDDAMHRQLIRWALEDEGPAVEAAGDSRDALERAARRKPALAIVDVALLTRSGIALAEDLRDLTDELFPIITTTAEDHTERKARRMRATECLRKPFDLEELIEAVRCALDSRQSQAASTSSGASLPTAAQASAPSASTPNRQPTVPRWPDGRCRANTPN